MRHRGFAVAALVVCCELAAPAGAAVLCKKKNAVLVVRDSTCKKQEAALDPLALGIRGVPLGSAHVLEDGTVDTANSVNVSASNISHSTGLYCFSGLAFTAHTVAVTLDPGGGLGPEYVLTGWAKLGALGCPDGTQVSVFVTHPSGFQDSGFFITFN